MLNVETDSLAQETLSAPARRRLLVRRGLAVSVAALAAVSLVGAATGAAAAPGGDCLWAGTAHAPGTAVVAGGRTFTCATDQRGPQWLRGAATPARSTVSNPGSRTRPTGTFSPGAQQPGTEYNDYCVGTQLVDGSESVYQVVSDGSGATWWKAAGPIAEWTFDPGTGRVPTTRSASLCPPDPAIWPPTQIANGQ